MHLSLTYKRPKLTFNFIEIQTTTLAIGRSLCKQPIQEPTLAQDRQVTYHRYKKYMVWVGRFLRGECKPLRKFLGNHDVLSSALLLYQSSMDLLCMMNELQNLSLLRFLILSKPPFPVTGIIVLLDKVLVSAIDNPILSDECSLCHLPST